LINVEELGITIQESVKGKGKKAELIESLIPFENISESIVLVSFK
jgi:ribosome maturation factor RimP